MFGKKVKEKTQAPMHAEQEYVNANPVMEIRGQNPAVEDTRTKEEILDDLMSGWEQLEHGEKKLEVGNFEETKKDLAMVKEREEEKREEARRKAEQEAAEQRIAQQRAAEQNAMREAGVNQQEDELFFPKNRGELLHEVDRWMFQAFQKLQSSSELQLSSDRDLILKILKCPEYERMAVYYLIEHRHADDVYDEDALIALSQLNYHPNLQKLKADGLERTTLDLSYRIIKHSSEDVLFWNHMGKTYSLEQLERRKEVLKKDSDNNAALEVELLELLKVTKDDDDERQQLMKMIGEVLSRRKVNLENESKANDKMLEYLTKLQETADEFYKRHKSGRVVPDSDDEKFKDDMYELMMQLWREYREYQSNLILKREVERKQQKE